MHYKRFLFLSICLPSYLAVKVILSFCHSGPPKLLLLPAAPKNCTCKFIQTPNKVEVEVEFLLLVQTHECFALVVIGMKLSL